MATKLIENEWHAKGYQWIAGFDEAGRGPLAGPLVIAGVILPADYDNPMLHDSKALTDKKRRVLFDLIKSIAIDYTIEVIPVHEVDRLNVYQASKLGMERCLARLATAQVALTDAMPLSVSIPVQSIIKGDAKSQSIAAASILAKVTRDDYMMALHQQYPLYGFDHHKGYGTSSHLRALDLYGITSEHRRTFAPVIERLKPTLFD